MVNSYESLLKNISPFFPRGKIETTLESFLKKGDEFTKFTNRPREDTQRLLNELVRDGWLQRKGNKIILSIKKPTKKEIEIYKSFLSKTENIASKNGYKFYNLPKKKQKILNRTNAWIDQQLYS
jgi:hypothetical protein